MKTDRNTSILEMGNSSSQNYKNKIKNKNRNKNEKSMER